MWLFRIRLLCVFPKFILGNHMQLSILRRVIVKCHMEVTAFTWICYLWNKFNPKFKLGCFRGRTNIVSLASDGSCPLHSLLEFTCTMTHFLALTKPGLATLPGDSFYITIFTLNFKCVIIQIVAFMQFRLLLNSILIIFCIRSWFYAIDGFLM